MPPYGAALLATALVLALAAARADPYVGTDDDGNLQLRSAQGQSVFANSVDLVGLIPFSSNPRLSLRSSGDGRRMEESKGWIAGSVPPPPPCVPMPKAVGSLAHR